MEHIIDSMPFNWVLLLTIVGESGRKFESQKSEGIL